MSNTIEKPVANMQVCVMKKSELVAKLQDNKKKHDVILATAQAGYWELAKDRIESKKKKLDEAIKDLKSNVEFQLNKMTDKLEQKQVLPHSVSYTGFNFDNSINLPYPEDHSSDFDRAIRMMESSIYDTVALNEVEFDAYVLNNWSWKNQFKASNSMFVDTMRGRYGLKGLNDSVTASLMLSGTAGASGPAGQAGVGYENIIQDTLSKGVENF